MLTFIVGFVLGSVVMSLIVGNFPAFTAVALKASDWIVAQAKKVWFGVVSFFKKAQ